MLQLDRVTPKRSIVELPRQELGEFLRAKRLSLDPEDLGLSPRSRRRTRGLSREEAAYLAGISADWYARLEGGVEAKPSAATLAAVANAFELTAAETSFVFSLAGLAEPLTRRVPDEARCEALEKLVLDPPRVASCVYDAYLTPVRWNQLADAMYQFSAHPTPLRRNLIARLADPYFVGYYGTHYEEVSRQLVGMFRRAFTFHSTPLAKAIYEQSIELPIFRKFWDQHAVADETLESGGPFSREHPVVGTIWIKSVNLFMMHATDQFMSVIAPGDETSGKKFDRLRRMGEAST